MEWYRSIVLIIRPKMARLCELSVTSTMFLDAKLKNILVALDRNAVSAMVTFKSEVDIGWANGGGDCKPITTWCTRRKRSVSAGQHRKICRCR
jgi:hypothetical protein